MTFNTTKGHLLLSFLSWEGAFLILSSFQVDAFHLLNVFGFPTLVILPGLLTLLILKIKGLDLWGYVGLTVGFSVLELMFLGLLGNTVLPHIGITRPLDRPVLLIEFAVLVNALGLVAWLRMAETPLSLKVSSLFDSTRDTILAFFPSIFVIMSLFGAIRLNNGASGGLTLFMLVGVGIYTAILLFYAKKVGPNVLPTAIFFLSLALLLMTSLRGWDITGHDIQREYSVFQLAKLNGFWSMAAYHDAYNACVSITILPTMVSNLLSFTDPYVYKVLFQILFALVPVLVYLIAGRYVGSTIAFLSTFYFISFPTFFGDMPFLNRQEIAFLFLALMFYLIFRDDLSIKRRRVLFILFGLGMTISHYTTTYTIIASLLVVVCARPFVTWVGRHLRKVSWFSQSGLVALSSKPEISRITALMVILLIGASFAWSSLLTNTASGSITRVFTETVEVILNNTKREAEANDLHYSLFSHAPVDPVVALRNYEKKLVAAARAGAAQGEYYSTTPSLGSGIFVAKETVLPLTKVGTYLQSLGIDISSFNNLVRQSSARLLQLFTLIGFLVVIFSRRFLKDSIGTEYLLMAVAGIFFMLAQLILPILSQEYGLLRAFQQSLIFLNIFLVSGSMVLFIKWERAGVVLGSVIAILFFLSSTGVITQSLGGYEPQLHLNNSGSYYDIYYTHAGEAAATTWLSERVNMSKGDQLQSESAAGFYSAQKGSSIFDTSPLSTIYPGILRPDAYVYLNYENVRKQQAIVSYNGSTIPYVYPIQFLNEKKDLIYDSSEARVYR